MALSNLVKLAMKSGAKQSAKKAAPKEVKQAREGLASLANRDEKQVAATKVSDELIESTQPVKVHDYEPPKNTIKAYKLFRLGKDGELYPLFVNSKKPIPIGKWLEAEAGELTTEGKVKSTLGPLAYRPGWHAGDLPMATHIGGKVDPATGKRVTDRKFKPNVREDNQVWAEVEMPADFDWQSVANSRARIKKDGTPDVKTAHITDELPKRGHYRYKTNSNMTGNWIISGEMKVTRILPDAEVKAINAEAGLADLPRISEIVQKKSGGRIERNPYGTDYQKLI